MGDCPDCFRAQVSSRNFGRSGRGTNPSTLPVLHRRVTVGRVWPSRWGETAQWTTLRGRRNCKGDLSFLVKVVGLWKGYSSNRSRPDEGLGTLKLQLKWFCVSWRAGKSGRGERPRPRRRKSGLLPKGSVDTVSIGLDLGVKMY